MPPSVRRLALTVLVIGAVFQIPTAASADSLSVAQINGDNVTPASMAGNLVGDGVTFDNVQYHGVDGASGTFSGGNDAIGFSSGVVLTTGDAVGVLPPNDEDSHSFVNEGDGRLGDTDLEAIQGVGEGNSHDAAALEFDFTPSQSPVFFNFVFGSEEYNEFANTPYNDVFAFFVNGQNCAMVPNTSTPVSVNNVNGGNPLGTDARNPEFFVNNDPDDLPNADRGTQLDGLTKVLTCQADVTPDATNHIKLAIADTGDPNLDSAVFLQTGSLSTTPPAGTITGRVVDDQNGNGTDDDEPGLSGVEVKLFADNFEGGASLVATTTSDDTGAWAFSDLNAGSYFVDETNPAGYDSTNAVPGNGATKVTDDRISVSLDADTNPSSSGNAFLDQQHANTADLSITKTDNPTVVTGAGPDPVSSAGTVAYKVTVHNAGPDPATGVSVTDTPTTTVTAKPTVLSASGTGWSCSILTSPSRAVCTRSTALASGADAPVLTVLVQAPTVTANTTMTNTATVTGNETDPDSGDTQAAETTLVRGGAGTKDFGATFCPGGATTCTATTDPGTGATATDPTVSTITVPADSGAAPQTITMSETVSPAGFCGGTRCSGQVLTFNTDASQTFLGVTDPTKPVVVTMIFDKTIKGGTQIYVKKGTAAPKLVANCTTVGIASPHPCVSEKNILLPNGDREFKVLFLQGDPTMGKR